MARVLVVPSRALISAGTSVVPEKETKKAKDEEIFRLLGALLRLRYDVEFLLVEGDPALEEIP